MQAALPRSHLRLVVISARDDARLTRRRRNQKSEAVFEARGDGRSVRRRRAAAWNGGVVVTRGLIDHPRQAERAGDEPGAAAAVAVETVAQAERRERPRVEGEPGVELQRQAAR